MIKVNWFSPLPPEQTDIAHYTMRILPELCELAEVTLWTDSQVDRPLPCDLAVAVRQFEAGSTVWRELNRADATFFHIGNNPRFHRGIWEISQVYPGIVVLHDFCLQHLFAAIYRDELNDQAAYRIAMQRHHGQRGLQAVDEFWSGLLTTEQLADQFPLTGLAIENAAGVVIHNAAGLGRPELASLPLACLPLPYPAHRFPALRRAEPPYRLIVFGYIGPNRRLEPFLEAWAGLAERDLFTLGIYGQLWDEAQIRRAIRRLGLQGQVEIHGFVPEQELDEALCRADLAINLRYPTMGEASGSQLRIWDHGLPSLVTDTGWYATLDKTTVCTVDPNEEPADIRHHLAGFASAPDRYAAVGIAGKNHLEQNHASAGYARELLAFAERVGESRHHSAVLRLADRVGSEIGLFADDRQIVQIAGQLASRLGGLGAEQPRHLDAE